MKRSIIVLFALLAAAARAEFNVPKNVYRMDKFDAAKAAAKTEKKPLTFVFSNEKSTCPLCCNATMEILKDLKQESILIYVESADWSKVPRATQEAINATELGKYIPKTVVMDVETKKVIAYVPYSRESSELSKSLKDARKKIEAEYGKPKRSGPAPLPAAQPQTTIRK